MDYALPTNLESCPLTQIEKAVLDLLPDHIDRVVIEIRPDGMLPSQIVVTRQPLTEALREIPQPDPQPLPDLGPATLTPSQEAIVDLVRDQPGLSGKQIASRLRISYGTARTYLARLIRLGRVVHRRQGYRIHCGSEVSTR